MLFTAGDAYIRDLEVVVPADCCAAIDPARHLAALDQMAGTLKADIRDWTELDLAALGKPATDRGRGKG